MDALQEIYNNAWPFSGEITVFLILYLSYRGLAYRLVTTIYGWFCIVQYIAFLVVMSWINTLPARERAFSAIVYTFWNLYTMRIGSKYG